MLAAAARRRLPPGSDREHDTSDGRQRQRTRLAAVEVKSLWLQQAVPPPVLPVPPPESLKLDGLGHSIGWRSGRLGGGAVLAAWPIGDSQDVLPLAQPLAAAAAAAAAAASESATACIPVV